MKLFMYYIILNHKTIMRQKIIENDEKKESLQITNQEIRICIICGYDNIESYEFGISCEECGALIGRRKC